MRALLQRVKRSSVTVDGAEIAGIGAGLNILLGVAAGDTQEDMEHLAQKVCGLRIFEDGAGKLNLSLADIGGEALVVSQFTLLADCSHGRRPGFTGAARPEEAIPLYEAFARRLAQLGARRVETGRFGADMQVEIINDGPVTIFLDTRELLKKTGRE